MKSKGYGRTADSNKRRRAQAQRVAEIYRLLTEAGETNVVVMGDLNDTPDSGPLEPLLSGTDLRNVFGHPDFDDGGHPGTYGSSLKDDKIDYILLSPALFDRVRSGGVFRTGMWPGVRPRKWEAYPEITRRQDAASDHAAVWVDLDLY